MLNFELTIRNTGYTAQVLGDALTYADHAGRSSSVQMEDVTLAIQSRVGWEFGGRVPKEVCGIPTMPRSHRATNMN